MKKVLSLILLIVLLCSAFAFSSCDAFKNIFVSTNDKGTEGLVYQLNADGDTCTVIGLQNCMESEIIIPQEYKGKTVTGIEDYAFHGENGITSITIPNTVTYVGKYAFSGANNLTDVYYLHTVEQMKNNTNVNKNNEVSQRKPINIYVDGELISRG